MEGALVKKKADTNGCTTRRNGKHVDSNNCSAIRYVPLASRITSSKRQRSRTMSKTTKVIGGLFCNSPLESLCKPCHDYVYLGSEVLGYQRGCDINGRPYKTQPIYIDKNKRAKAGGWPKT